MTWNFATVMLLMVSFQDDGVWSSDAEERLFKDIFKDYNPDARPVRNDTDTVNVTFGLSLHQIVDVHEKNQLLVISAFIRQIWSNPLLSWKPSQYNDIQAININPKKIWRPDIVLYNNADEDKTFGGNLDRLNTRAILNYTGKITWLAPVILKSKCDIDVKYFPFDTQNCSLKFGSWTYDTLRMDFHPEKNEADLKEYSKNSEWKLKSTHAKRSLKKYVCCPEYFPDVTYYIIISRRSLFYLCNLIFPMTIIGMLTMLSFLLPAESGERVSLAITLLLAMTVFMLVVADIIPATSDVIPLVGMFFSASMVEMVVMIVVLCYIMRLYHKDSDDPPMSLWMRRFVLNWLSYKVKIRVRKEKDEEDNKRKFLSMNHLKNGPACLLNNQENMQTVFFHKKKTQNVSEANWVKNNAVTSIHNVTKQVNDIGLKKPTDSELLLMKLDTLVEKVKSMEEEDEIKTEWRIVAMTIDRCLLVFFAVVFLITLFACFSRAPGYVP